ncbi:MAG: ABC transporter permease, partial [Terriglobia bacterium]
MKTAWTLTRIRMRLALRNRAFIFFSLVMPLAFLFLYSSVFARGEPHRVAYMLPAVLALTVMGSFWGLSIQLVSFREQGILRRFRLTPVGPWAMMTSSVLSNYVLTLPTLVLEVLLARWLYGVRDFGNLWGAFVLLTLGTIAFASLGLIVASVTNSMQETQVINNAIWFVLLFLSGATIPLPFLPDWVQRVGMFLPATHLVTGLQQVLLASVATFQVGAEALVLAGGSVMAFLVAVKLFRWEP